MRLPYFKIHNLNIKFNCIDEKQLKKSPLIITNKHRLSHGVVYLNKQHCGLS